MTLHAVNPRSILPDAEGPWLPLTDELRAELVHRLTTTEFPAAVLDRAQLRGPKLSRQARTGILAWIEEKNAGAGRDWPAPTMWRYRAILRHLGPPAGEGSRRRQAGRAHLRSVATTGSLAMAGAGAAAGSPRATAVALVLVYITVTADKIHVMSTTIVFLIEVDQAAAPAPLQLAA